MGTVVKRSTQKGTVLIITVLIVAIITGLAIDFTSRFQLSLSRAENRLALMQVNQLVFAAEHAAIFGLKEDKKNDDNDGNAAFDHLNEDWKAREFEFQGFLQILIGNEAEIISVSLEDAQGRFNLNQLGSRSTVIDFSQPFSERYRTQEKRFIRLLQTVPGDLVTSDEAESILHAVIDWIDVDNNTTGTAGAEADFYQTLEKPYSPANQNFVSVSELRQVKGITEEIYEHLRPLSSALPTTDALININTALPEIMRTMNSVTEIAPINEDSAAILSSGRPTLTSGNRVDIDQSGQANKKVGFKTIEAFFNSEEVITVFGQDENLLPSADGLSTGTSYFFLRSDIQLGNLRRQVYSLLQRSRDTANERFQVSVIRRGSDDVF
jgi:general secretion pathway protein K